MRTERNNQRMKRIFFYLLCLTFLLTACHESLEDKAAREAKEYTRKNCPKQISDNIVNDSMTFDKDTRTLHYYFTMTGQADTSAIDKQQAKEKITKAVKDAMSIRTYKDKGFNFAYTYYSEKNKGEILLDIKITPQDYGKQ